MIWISDLSALLEVFQEYPLKWLKNCVPLPLFITIENLLKKCTY